MSIEPIVWASGKLVLQKEIEFTFRNMEPFYQLRFASKGQICQL